MGRNSSRPDRHCQRRKVELRRLVIRDRNAEAAKRATAAALEIPMSFPEVTTLFARNHRQLRAILRAHPEPFMDPQGNAAIEAVRKLWNEIKVANALRRGGSERFVGMPLRRP